jgi:hypothetical protein
LGLFGSLISAQHSPQTDWQQVAMPIQSQDVQSQEYMLQRPRDEASG